ncbi:MAG: bifunctional UDP-N-acetylglucosamine diphosphorylase/glucosamine-1-phosphate N-acetyltransferase GlmU [Deltaproteobacteria bacterium]|jgi:bifunctional UDP-N-acetylglucosamine pyrophosphorylase / glucosamine-1-phosphate N-acetyltransferase|nr:bifunctional UDP-N-acetylglucosamine diphosphorylase/glucosamine-1-phosphate N-acetyltransferase GlmU [Deltaproteobacteria bacterium]
MSKLVTVILAAGQSTRMKSKRSKVLHNLAGQPVISYVVDIAKKGVKSEKVIVVVGPKQDDLRKYLKENHIAEAIQKQPLGTGNAVQASENKLKGFDGYVLVLCGDVPLLQAEVVSSFIKRVKSKNFTLGVLTMTPSDAGNYGRIVRDLDGEVIKIVEARDASEEELKIREVNSGILCFDAKWLFKSLKKLSNKNVKGEYYITDLVGIALKEGASVVAFNGEPAHDLLGINTRIDLARAYEIMRERINKKHMLGGVGLLDYRHINIDANVKIGADTSIMPYSFIRGDTRIGKDCIIENGVVIENAVIGDGVHIKAHSVIEDSKIADGAIVGPFSRVRPDSKVGKGARVGNFVELKKCDLKDGAKANHLSYLGDASIGSGVNIGCGTITCNYDGVSKYRTVIGDNVFVGSDTQFVAPVRIGKCATIGAGSTITKDVPADALALSRSDQKIIKNWSKKRKKKKSCS